MGKGNKGIKIVFLLTVLSTAIFFFSTSYLEWKRYDTSITLMIYDDNWVANQQKYEKIFVDFFTYNSPSDRFRITEYPTYVLVKSTSQDVLLVTNKLEDVKKFVKKLDE